ncbi:MAG: type II toxin-antitoxin system CcdA family antitoxin [Polaromonas sp.]|uniref:type II toxin-antitoxin system CcdA family antitoxin n=1 Tax=Polaromonas sp. TaxID=1869339 RepID=UPI0027321F14|nr:type II toxin-antitoxin system CcdA family antitoxin [Polaromonas sp.]MDP2255111.1 type II toxin-antitoxin system CcdA family antitoxin [Polaromonas sp.]
MLQSDSPPMTVVTLGLDSKMLDLADQLGINISETVDRLLLIEVEKRLQERDDPGPQPVSHP